MGRKNNKNKPEEIKVKFPGDKCPKKPDFLIAGAGLVALPLAYKLTDQGYRVLAIETGPYYKQNNPTGEAPLCDFPNIIAGEGVFPPAPNDAGLTCTELEIKYPFKVQPFNGFLNIGIINANIDPVVSTWLGNPSGLGDGFLASQSWSAPGVGGGGNHFFCDYVRPNSYVFEGPLTPGMVPPDNTSVYPFSQAAGVWGSFWTDAAIQNIITNQIENYIDFGITSECPAYRGVGGPESVLINGFPYPLQPDTDPWVVQNAMSNAAGTVPGGVAAPIVADYNCPTNLSCVSQLQFFFGLGSADDLPTVIRQNSATAWANENIVSLDNEGNLHGKNGRKLVILTNRTVVRAVKDKKRSQKLGKYVAAGVHFMHNNNMYFVKCRNLVASMGAVRSPCFWMRSGIGPADALAEADIPLEVNSPFIGKNFHNQYGGRFTLVTDNLGYGLNFNGQAFIQYNNQPRAWQLIQLGIGSVNIGVVSNVAYPTDPFNSPPIGFLFDLFMVNPRTRGEIRLRNSDINSHPLMYPNYYSDGPDPTDPYSGLGDMNTDIQSSCYFADYVYQVYLQMKALDPTSVIQLVSPPEEIFQIADTAERHKQLVPYLTMNSSIAAHEAGTVVMNDDPAKGACSGALLLHGTRNCFQADFSIAPLQSSGNPSSMLQALGLQAGVVIPKVALL